MSRENDRENIWQVLRAACAIALLVLLAVGAARAWRCRPTQCLGVDQSDIRRIHAAIDEFALDNGHYPARLSDLTAPGPDGEPYLRCSTPIPLDPWGNPYEYRPATPTTSHEVTTSGR